MRAQLEVTIGPAGVARPRVYGYLRLPDRPDDSATVALENAMRDFAESHSLHFLQTFFELSVGTCDGLQELVGEIHAVGACILLVPSATHLAASLLLQNVYIERLEAEASAAVVMMDGADV